MRAITYSSYGPPDVLELTDVEKPVPKDDEVLIRVRAAEATKSDCEMRSFEYSVKWFWLPLSSLTWSPAVHLVASAARTLIKTSSAAGLG